MSSEEDCEEENANRGVWEKIAARFVGQLSWETEIPLQSIPEKHHSLID